MTPMNWIRCSPNPASSNYRLIHNSAHVMRILFGYSEE